MPIDKKYLDHFYVKNLTNRVVTLGDLVNLEVGKGKTVDLLTVPMITKEKINQSHDLQTAVRSGFLRILKDNCASKSRTKAERQAVLADEDKSLCDLEDVSTSVASPSDNDLLQFNSDTGKWETIQPEDLQGPDVNVTSVSSDYDITCDDDVVLCDASNGPITVVLPKISRCVGKKITVKKIDDSDNVVTIDGYGEETIDTELNQYLTVQFDSPQLINDYSSDWYIV